MEVAALWTMSGLFASPFVYCLHGTLRGEIDIGRISRSPSVDGYLHGPRGLAAHNVCVRFLSVLALTIYCSSRDVQIRQKINND